MSAQTSLEAWASERPSVVEHDLVVKEYIIGSPELPTSIGDFDLVRGPTFERDYAVRYEDATNQSVRARWSDRHRAFVIRVDVEDEPHGFLRPDGTVGGLLTAGDQTIDHGTELQMFENLVSFVQSV